MTFVNEVMLFGLLAVSVPILIHLLNRRRAKILDWGAMRFLLASLTSQNRRILIEEIILLVLRCLIVALVVLAMARPFLPSRSRVPWAIVLPAFLGAVVCLAVAGAMWAQRKSRWALLAAAVFLATLAGLATAREQIFQEIKWARARGETDLALLIDASMSMTVSVEGRTNFERAVEEARRVVDACQPGDAVSLILAGPVPRLVIAAPTADRVELGSALDKLAPIGGTMGVLEALNVAAASLAEGSNALKKIVLITDGQNVGWDVRSEARWRFLAEGLAALASPPKIICRRLPLPQQFRNAAVADVTLSRKVVGTDRPVRINVKVMNTCSMPIKPSAVELSVDGAPGPRERMVTEILPKAAETVHFEHRFTRPGPRLVSARVILNDDLAADNTSARVVSVIDKLDVLLVDGTPSPRPLGGAAAFIDIGLTPRSEADEAGPPDKPAKGRRDIDDIEFLVEPKVVPAPDIATVTDLSQYAVVVLANVPRLPEEVARKVVSFVQNGGGLLIAPGIRVKPTFYNGWVTRAAEPVAPARLDGRREVHNTPARLEPKTFRHPALELLSDPKHSDVGSALVKSYWTLVADERDSDVRVGGRLHTGEPFVVERKLGKGYVLMTATSLDHKGGNLPALKCFVPLLHELVYYLAAPMMLEANVAPGSEMTIELHDRSFRRATGGAGLRAEYFDDRYLTQRVASRIDPVVNFAWGPDRPHPDVDAETFSVRWSGYLQPRYSQRYTFYALADDGVRLWVDGKQIINGWREQNPTEYHGSIALSAGRKVPIRMEYFESTGDAVAVLQWSSRSQSKQIIPQSQLYPSWRGLSADAPASARAKGPADDSAVEVLTPSQRRRPARLTGSDGSLRVTFTETQEPGLYTLLLPDDMARVYAPDVGDGKGVPFVVVSKVEESFLDGLTEADLQKAGQHVKLFETTRTDELASHVAGGVPGEELWKYLAIGTLLVLLGEIAVSRWVAIQRRLNATETVVFGSETVDVQTFRDRARELLAIPSEPPETVAKS